MYRLVLSPYFDGSRRAQLYNFVLFKGSAIGGPNGVVKRNFERNDDRSINKITTVSPERFQPAMVKVTVV